MPLPVDGLPARIHQLSLAALSVWDQSHPRTDAAQEVHIAFANLRSSGDSTVVLVTAIGTLLACITKAGDDAWLTEELRVLLRALDSTVRQFGYSADSKAVVRLCSEIREAVNLWVGVASAVSANRLLAGLMVVEDAVSAMEAYRASQSFRYPDEGYLAKFGLLQALQLGFDAAGQICRELGVAGRADGSDNGKTVKIVRNIVAGHPLGGSMPFKMAQRGLRAQHYHDRGSVHDKDVLKIMSFSDDDPTNWTGQTHLTETLITNGLHVIQRLLQQARAQLPAST